MYEALNQHLDIKIVHTGQHYDHALSQVFFDELSSIKPSVNLNVGSGSQVFQVAEIMLRLEKYLIKEKSSIVLVPGDTNSALAGALTSVKMNTDLAHLESGARSYDMIMSEEVNRRLIDHCSKILFAPTSNCKKNLEVESVTGAIFQSGDTMYDAFLHFQNFAKKKNIVEKMGLAGKEYLILTSHRAENVDDPKKLGRIFQALQKNNQIQIIFPVHPRTKERMIEYGIHLNNPNIKTIDPLSYIEMLSLLDQAKLVITDSGGLQKEAFWSKVPCITIRDRTEWIETVDLGVNFVTGVDFRRIIQMIKQIMDDYTEIKSRFRSNPFGDGKASERIVRVLKEKIDS
jgi:UDP-GlcNAc3NAcA epimerase